MQNTRYFTVITSMLFLVTVLTSCDKFLEVTPKGYTLLNTVGDYDQWLNDPVLTSNIPTQLDLPGDNIDMVAVPNPPVNPHELIYSWQPQFNTEPNVPPIFWGTHYANINKYNTVLQGIGNASGGTAQQKASLKAEALVGRAFEYFYLINEYAKPYDAATASKDPGVPFVTSHEVTQLVPERSTVQEVYDRIIADINTALPDLPEKNSQNRLRPDKAAAYSVLARIYLYSRDYEKAANSAQLALQQTAATMLDHNALPANEAKNTSVSSRADVIYGRTAVAIPAISLQFIDTYDRRDLRFKWFRSTDGFKARGNTLFAPFITYPFFTNTNYGTSVQEMKLILAEAAARKGELSAALQQLNEIRIKRLPQAAYQPLQSSDANEVLAWVLRERTFEFPVHGLRWFDMRRLDKEGRMPAVSRLDAKGNVIATLSPNSPRYTFQIPMPVMQFSPEMVQNP